MKASYTRERHNPIELIKKWWPEADISHITYDETMKPLDRQYWRMDSSGGDGTLLFTMKMLEDCLLPLINRKSTYLPEEPEDWSTVKDIKYTIGRISHATVYGMVELRCGGKHPGQKERVRIPVRCEYVFN